MTADRLRAAVEAHKPEHGYTQWYVDEHVIDCDAEEFWAVIERAELAAVKCTLAAAYRQAAEWIADDAMRDVLRSLAEGVETFEPGDACCPCCEEVTCDAGCPLEPVRRQS